MTTELIDPIEARERIFASPHAFAEQVRDFWLRGDLEFLLRPNGQTTAYRFIHECRRRKDFFKPIVLETHRRLGKTFLKIVIAAEVALSSPGRRVIYGLPTEEDYEFIVVPNMNRFLELCPMDLRPTVRGTTWTFRNPTWPEGSAPSTLEIFGINKNKDAGRGGGCDAVFVDEAGYHKHLEYWLKNVAAPQLMGRGSRPFMILSSTPPESMAHPFITTYCHQAIQTKRYIGIRASENQDCTEEDKEIVKGIIGSETSIAWLREMEIQHVSDPSKMIVPEVLRCAEELFREWTRPDYFFPLAVGDLGWEDYCHILFAYVDFENQRLVIEDEIHEHYVTTGTLAGLWRDKERERFADLPHRIRRSADAQPLVLAGLSSDHHLPCSSVIKHDADATLARLRTGITQGRVAIHPRCTSLIYQLQNGVRDDKGKWVRSDLVGHCDGIAALAYAYRLAPWQENPVPILEKGDKRVHPMIAAIKESYHG